jgi:hypothetical protein
MLKRALAFLIFTAFPLMVSAEDFTMSETESLSVAEDLTRRGAYDGATKIYSTLLNSPDANTRVESVFRLAGIAMANGDYDAAIRYYRAIVDNNPGLYRARLELARAYFMNRDYADAEFHFQFVRATDGLPTEVADKIDEFLALIRQQKNWTLDFGFGIVPDSNLNSAGTAKEECLNTMWGQFCRPLETAKSGTGLRLNAEGNYYTRFTKRFGLRSTLGINALDFPKSDFDDIYLYFASGPRYVFDSAEISLQPTASARWYAGDFYNYSYGLSLDANWQVSGRWLLGAGATVRQNHYDTDYVQDAVGGYDWDLYLRPRYYMDNKSFIMAGVGFDQSHMAVKSYGTDTVSYSVGYFGEFWWGFTFLGRIDLLDVKYRDSSIFVADGALVERVRSDNTWQFYTRISNNKLGWYNLVPALSYMYMTRDSNIPGYVFDKHRVELEIIRRF